MTKYNHNAYYVHEGYARKLGNRRFVGGMLLGMAIMWTLPAFKYFCKRFNDKYDELKKQDDKSEEPGEKIEFSEEDFM